MIEEKPKEKKEFHWKNLFDFNLKRDWKTLLFVAWILIMVWAYKHDTAVCHEVVENPGEFCTNWCEASWRNQNFVATTPGVNLSAFGSSG